LGPADDFEGNEQIRRLSSKHKITAEELGQRLNISQQAANAIGLREKDGSVAIKSMQKIADALGYTFQYRFVLKKNMVPDENQNGTQPSCGGDVLKAAPEE